MTCAAAWTNVARLAALVHVLQHGPAGTIGADHLLGAEEIVRWHLHEARRLLAELDTPPALAAAIRLDTWLLNEAHATGSPRSPTTRIYQYGPGCVRDSRDLKAALATLSERGRARLEEEGRRRFVAVNPALLDGRGRSPAKAVVSAPGALLLLLFLRLPAEGRACAQQE